MDMDRQTLWEIPLEKSRQILREAFPSNKTFDTYAPFLVGMRMYRQPECTSELIQFISHFLAKHDLDQESLQEICEAPSSEEDVIALKECIAVLGWIHNHVAPPSLSTPTDAGASAFRMTSAVRPRQISAEVVEEREEKIPARFEDYESYQQLDTVVDVIQGMFLEEKRLIFETAEVYGKLWCEIWNIPNASGIGNKILLYRQRDRSAQKRLADLSHPSPLLDGPNLLEFTAMLLGFLTFAQSYRFTRERDFVAFVFKAQFEVFEERFKQPNPWTVWDTASPFDREDWPPANWEQHFSDSASRMNTELPLSLMKRDGSQLCHRLWTDEDEVEFVCSADDRRQHAPQKMISHFSTSCISFDAMKIEGVVRVYVMFAGHRVRVRGSEGIRKLIACMSQMIVVDPVNVEEVTNAVTEIGGKKEPFFQDSTGCMKIMLLNDHVFREVLRRFDTVEGVRIGNDEDYDALWREMRYPFIERLEDVHVDRLQAQLHDSSWFSNNSSRRLDPSEWVLEDYIR